MVVVPAGSFTMGVPDGEEAAEGVVVRGQAQPQLRVTLSQPFALGKYPVTRGQFLAFVTATGHQAGNSCWQITQVSGGARWTWQDRPGATWREPGIPQTADDPVVCVAWHDARAYVAWLSQRTGQRYRLPSEAEWEYAARAGTSGPRWWNGARDQACAYANVRDLTLAISLRQSDGTFFQCIDTFDFTAPVGRFPNNPFGLGDMLGNVWQWVEDCWYMNLSGMPQNGTARLSGDCSRRVLRGSSWLSDASSLRAGNRSWDVVGSRAGHMGFRVARTP